MGIHVHPLIFEIYVTFVSVRHGQAFHTRFSTTGILFRVSPGLGNFLQVDYVTTYNNTSMNKLIVHYNTLYSDQILGGGG